MTKRGVIRYIKPEVTRIGDLVSMYTTTGDMVVTNVGVIARREHVGRATHYYTSQGNLLGIDWRDGITKLGVTLLKPAPELETPTLEGLEG